MVLYHQKRYAQAADEFRKELAQVPNSSLAMAMLSLSLHLDRKRDEAIEVANAAIAADPNRALAHYALACAIIGPSRAWKKINLVWRTVYRSRLKKAIPCTMEAIRLNSHNADHLSMMAGIKYDMHRPREALEWTEKALAVDPNHIQSLNLRARSLARLGRSIEARQASQAALALNPESATTHAHGGWMHLQSGDPKKAVEHFQESVRLDPNNPATHRGLEAARRSARLGKKIGIPVGITIVLVNLVRILLTNDYPTGSNHAFMVFVFMMLVLSLAIVLFRYVRSRR